jgi:hypothetical protein
VEPVPPIRINPAASLRREPIGEEHFCIVVDDFLLAQEVLIDYAAKFRDEFSHPNVGYPGRQIRVNDDAMKEI